MIVDEPGYLKNLTKIMSTASNRTVANYMMWRAARASLGYFNEDARKIQLSYAKNITGKKTETPRWRSCTGGNTFCLGLCLWASAVEPLRLSPCLWGFGIGFLRLSLYMHASLWH